MILVISDEELELWKRVGPESQVVFARLLSLLVRQAPHLVQVRAGFHEDRLEPDFRQPDGFPEHVPGVPTRPATPPLALTMVIRHIESPDFLVQVSQASDKRVPVGVGYRGGVLKHCPAMGSSLEWVLN